MKNTDNNKSEYSKFKKPSPGPIILAVILSFAGIGASVYAFNSYFDENPIPVDLLIHESTDQEDDGQKAEPVSRETVIREKLTDAANALAEGRYSSAQKNFLDVLAEDSSNQTAKNGILQVYEAIALQDIRNAAFASALDDLKQLEELAPSRTAPLKAALTDAMIAEAANQNETSAKSLYEQILSFDEENIDAYEGLVKLALADENYAEANRMIREYSDPTDSDRLLRFLSKLPFGLARDLEFKQITSPFDNADYPVLLFDNAYNILTENDEISVVREPMVTEITEFSRTLPDENNDVTYTFSLHHKAHVTVMIDAASEYAKSGPGFLVSGNFPVFFDYYTGETIPLPQEGTVIETCLSWNGKDLYLYSDTWGDDQTTDDGSFKRDGANYVRNVYYEYTQTATIKCPADYDGLCLAFYDSTVQNYSDISNANSTFIRVQEYQNLTTLEEPAPAGPDASGDSQASSSSSGSSRPQSQSPGESSSKASQTPGSKESTPSSETPSSGSSQSEESSQPPETPSSEEPQSEESSQPPETPSSEEPQSQEPAPAPQVSTDSYVDDVISLVNLERSNAGLGSVSSTAELNAAAQARASEIIESFSHTRPDGTSCFTILAPYGISYSTAGENIAAGQSSPESVMDAWMNSEGHRANILNGSFNHIGVGFIKTDSGYRYYWVQLFTD